MVTCTTEWDYGCNFSRIAGCRRVLTLHCCGEDYYADESHIGGHIQCGRCGRVLTIASRTLPSSVSTTHPGAQTRTVARSRIVTARNAAKWRLPNWRFVAVRVILTAFSVSITLISLANRRVRSARTPAAKVPVPVQVEPNLSSPSIEIREQVPVSLPTGTWLVKPRGIPGDGVLQIENGSDLDSVVKLVTAASPQTTIWMLYIRAHDHKSVRAIGDGNYLLRFALGLDWDANSRKFRKDRAYYQAGKQLDFIEVPPTSDGTASTR
jgi:hypothetical protein